jgi:oligoribonuclease NrnB/cAMP/cGMP phosphodiesterase (DHH superfamily)
MKPLIIYHDKCTDGFGAAFAAWCKFGDDAEYLPMSYGSGWVSGDAGHVDRTCLDRNVYVLDFSFERGITEQIIASAKKFVWLDHHKTAFEMWAGEERARYFEDDTQQPEQHSYILLDNNKSGAMLAWEYFHPDKAVPDLIKRIDDRDRWVFQYPDSKALHAGLQRAGFDFNTWKSLTPLGGEFWFNDYSAVVRNGNIILNVYADQIRDRVRAAEKCYIALPLTHATPGGNAPPGIAVNSTAHASEIGHELAKASGTYGLIWYYDAAAKRANVSLRSIGGYDVSAIAKAFGGGGHRNAAGFNIDMPTLLGWLK